MKSNNNFYNRRKKGTPEWLIYKWTRKLWKIKQYYDNPECVLPSFMRTEFERDIRTVVERALKDICPEKSLLGTITSIRGKDD